MKIGILTWLHNGNYGSILQAYALQKALRNQGYQTENIDYAPSTVKKVENLIKNKNSLKLFLEKWDAYCAKKVAGSPRELSEKQKKFDDFRENYINITRRYSSPKEVATIDGEFDAYICGSDQIWSPVLLNPVFYFDFLSDTERKIAYACSFGVSSIKGKKATKITNYLNRFDYISVRESSGCEIVKSLTGKVVPVMPDPTLLLQRTDWDKVSKYNLNLNNYIFCYFLSWNEDYWKYVENVSQQLGYQIVIVPSVKQTYQVNAKILKNIGPEEWVGLIKNASYVITDSFHGTVFSIIYNKPFTVLKRFSDDNPRSQNSRIYTLLEHYNLTNRLGTNTDIFNLQEYTKVNSQVECDRRYALEWLNSVLKVEKVEDIPHANCNGCGLCSIVCPKQCIEMKEKHNGFLYPHVNKKDCIGCDLCIKKCPEYSFIAREKVKQVYAAKTRDRKLITESTSGGIFGELAKSILDAGGVVYGAAYVDVDVVRHQRISNISELYKLSGSKYVQSEISSVYPMIKEDLLSAKNVLFSGTGCQIAAIRNYLPKDFNNLICVEVVCHGVPAPGLFKKYIKWLSQKGNASVLKYQFRSKCERPTGEHSKYYYETSKGLNSGYSYEDPYYGSFLCGSILRNSCYKCNFKGRLRSGDITIGDFWGIEKTNSKINTDSGISLVMINTEKGNRIFAPLKNRLDLYESSFEEAEKFNPSISHSTASKKRISIDCTKEDVIDTQLSVNSSIKNRIKNRLPWRVKKILKRIL